MFVERSAARIQLVRTLFVLACLLPTLGLAAWAVYRHSAGYVDPLLASWSRSIGLTITVDRLEHLRPAVIRLRDVALSDSRQHQVAAVAEAEVETRDGGTLLRLPRLSLDASGTAALAALARSWLTEPVRFPRGGAVQVDELLWTADGSQRSLGGFRLELVVVGTDRAIRIRREPADDDELRLRAITSTEGLRLEAELTCNRGLPAELVASVSGWLPRFGSAATIRGRLQGTATEKGVAGPPPQVQWSGRGDAVVTGVELAGLAGAVGQSARGDAVLRIERLEVEQGRITAARLLLSAENGSLGRGLLERLVTVLGCRFGPGSAPFSAGSDWLNGPSIPFDEAACAVELDASGVVVEPAGLGGATLVASRGAAVLEAANARIPYERFAWFFAATTTGMLPATIPASPQALEVLSRLPLAGEAPAGRF